MIHKKIPGLRYLVARCHLLLCKTAFITNCCGERSGRAESSHGLLSRGGGILRTIPGDVQFVCACVLFCSRKHVGGWMHRTARNISSEDSHPSAGVFRYTRTTTPLLRIHNRCPREAGCVKRTENRVTNCQRVEESTLQE